MPRRRSMSTDQSSPDDPSLTDPEAWDNESAEDVQPRPSGMVVFSLRLPAEEFRLLKDEADRRHTTMSELARTALRFYLLPRATGTLSVTAIHHVQVTSYTPRWTGGITNPASVTPELAVPTPAPPQGNADR
jgi:hypothetical protein